MKAGGIRTWATIGVVIVAIGAAFAVNRLTTSHATQTSSVTATLIAQADLPECPSASGSGKAQGGLPSITLPCLGNGPKVDLAKLRGPLVVNIWAARCPPCVVEAPMIEKFNKAASGKVSVLGVVDGAYPDTRNDALDASGKLGLRYPSVFDEHGKLVADVRTSGIPTTLFVRPDGTVAYMKVGQLSDGELPQLTKQYLGIEVNVSS